MGNLDDWKQLFFDWHYWAGLFAAGFLLGILNVLLDEFRWRRQRRKLDEREQQRRKHDERRERQWRSRIEQQWRDDHQQRSAARDGDDADGSGLDDGRPVTGRWPR